MNIFKLSFLSKLLKLVILLNLFIFFLGFYQDDGGFYYIGLFVTIPIAFILIIIWFIVFLYHSLIRKGPSSITKKFQWAVFFLVALFLAVLIKNVIDNNNRINLGDLIFGDAIPLLLISWMTIAHAKVNHNLFILQILLSILSLITYYIMLSIKITGLPFLILAIAYVTISIAIIKVSGRQ